MPWDPLISNGNWANTFENFIEFAVRWVMNKCAPDLDTVMSGLFARVCFALAVLRCTIPNYVVVPYLF